MEKQTRSAPIVVELAMRQHGVVTRAQLLAAGMPSKAVERRARTGELRRVHPGVYLLGTLRGPLEPARARQMAAVLACGRDAALSHRSAGRLWGLLRTPGRRNAKNGEPLIDIVIPHDVRRRHRGIQVHRPTDLVADDVTRLDRIPITTVCRTLRDLSSILTARDLNRVAARGEKEGLVDAASFPDLVARHHGRPGAAVLRVALLGDGGPVITESEAEERFLDLVAEAGLPRPLVNAEVRGYRADFYWPDERLIVEVDGFAFHSSRGSFEGDHRRDIDLESKGVRVIRVTWRQIVRERTATGAKISAALALAAARGG